MKQGIIPEEHACSVIDHNRNLASCLRIHDPKNISKLNFPNEIAMTSTTKALLFFFFNKPK